MAKWWWLPQLDFRYELELKGEEAPTLVESGDKGYLEARLLETKFSPSTRVESTCLRSKTTLVLGSSLLLADYVFLP